MKGFGQIHINVSSAAGKENLKKLSSYSMYKAVKVSRTFVLFWGYWISNPELFH